MEDFLLKVGLGCIIAGIIGGGLEFVGIKVPLLDSRGRQVALCGLGGVLVAASAIPYLFKPAVISGRVIDISSSQGISGVRITLTDKDSKTLQRDIFTTALDGGFQFSVPRGLNKNQFPLSFQLSRNRWAATYVPDEKVIDASSDKQINLPVDLVGLVVIEPSPSAQGKNLISHRNVVPVPQTLAPHADKISEADQRMAGVAGKNLGKSLLSTGTLHLFVRPLPDYLDFELHVRPTDSPALNFDVNKNDQIDANLDVTYALLDSGNACPQYRRTINSWSSCGGFRSDSNVTINPGVENGVAIKVIVWHIPRIEINAANGDAHLTVRVFNEVTKAFFNFPSEDFSQTLRTL